MTEEQVDLLLVKIDSLVDALNLNMNIPSNLTEEERLSIMESKKQTALLNAEIQLLYAQKELQQLKQ